MRSFHFFSRKISGMSVIFRCSYTMNFQRKRQSDS